MYVNTDASNAKGTYLQLKWKEHRIQSVLIQKCATHSYRLFVYAYMFMYAKT